MAAAVVVVIVVAVRCVGCSSYHKPKRSKGNLYCGHRCSVQQTQLRRFRSCGRSGATLDLLIPTPAPHILSYTDYTTTKPPHCNTPSPPLAASMIPSLLQPLAETHRWLLFFDFIARSSTPTTLFSHLFGLAVVIVYVALRTPPLPLNNSERTNDSGKSSRHQR